MVVKALCKCGKTFKQDDPAQTLCDECLEAAAREAEIAHPSLPQEPESEPSTEAQKSITAPGLGLRKICVTCKNYFTPLCNAQKQCSDCKAKASAKVKEKTNPLPPPPPEKHELIYDIVDLLLTVGAITQAHIDAAKILLQLRNQRG